MYVWVNLGGCTPISAKTLTSEFKINSATCKYPKAAQTTCGDPFGSLILLDPSGPFYIPFRARPTLHVLKKFHDELAIFF